MMRAIDAIPDHQTRYGACGEDPTGHVAGRKRHGLAAAQYARPRRAIERLRASPCLMDETVAKPLKEGRFTPPHG
jgi:hypothetical protein